MPEIHAARRRRAQEKITEAGADAALITFGPNVRYLTGLASSNAALLLAADGTAVLATDSRYTLAARRDCPDVELLTERIASPDALPKHLLLCPPISLRDSVARASAR